MTAQDMPEAVAEDKVSRILRARALGEAQTDLEAVTGRTVQPAPGARLAGVDAGLVKRTVEAIEAVEHERALLADDIKEHLDTAKKGGLDPKVIRELLRERKKKPEELDAQLSLLDHYRSAMGG